MRHYKASFTTNLAFFLKLSGFFLTIIFLVSACNETKPIVKETASIDRYSRVKTSISQEDWKFTDTATVAVNNPFFQQSMPFKKGLLFEVAKLGEKPSWILGTIHSDDKRIMTIPEIILKKLDKSIAFLLEIDFEAPLTKSIQEYMYYPEGKTLQEVLTPELYQTTLAVAKKRNYTEAMIHAMKPWAVMVSLSTPPLKGTEFLDFKLYHLAKEKKIKVIALETADEQLTIFDQMSLEDQIFMLQDLIDNFSKVDALFEQLLTAWIDKDLAKIAQISDQEMARMPKVLRHSFSQNLLYKRNKKMIIKAEPSLEKGYAFIAVGALHLTGTKGILVLLQEKGYKIKKIY